MSSSSRQHALAARATAMPQYSRPGADTPVAPQDHAAAAFTSPPADVETTNWNAVKMLASKYGISLKSAADVQNSAVARAQQAEEDGSAQNRSANSEDLGVGTPFEITATKLEGGRFIYRFKWRGHSAPSGGSSEVGRKNATDGRQPGQGENQTDVSFVPRSVSSGAIVSGNGRPFGPEELAAQAGQSRFRKSGSFMLKSSRSIPVLRGNRSASSNQSRSPFAVAAGEAAATELTRGGLFLPNRQAAAALGDRSDAPHGVGPSAWHGLGSSSLAPAAGPSSSSSSASRSASAAAGGSVAMARAESTPVKGAHAKRNWTGRLEEGDVLGAILGLRQEAVWTAVGDSGRGEAEPLEVLRTPDVNLDQASELPSKAHAHLRKTADPSLLGFHDGHTPSIQVRPFGSDVLLQPEPPHTFSRAMLGVQRPFPADRSADLTDGTDPGLFSTEHVLPELDLGNRFAMSSRVHHLREVPSSASVASDATARGDSATSTGSVDDPATRPPAGREQEQETASGIVLFDVLQDYTRPPPTHRDVAATASTPRSSSADNVSSHRRFNSADLLTSYSMQGNVEAQKHFIAEAQSLPTSAAPGDDPRFALWAVRSDRGDGVLIAAGRDGDTSAMQSLLLGSSVHSLAGNKRRGGRTVSSSSSSSTRVLEESISDGSGRSARSGFKADSRRFRGFQQGSDLFATGKAVLLAATPARLVAEITSEIDQRLLTDFFYTYRDYMAPSELLRLLTLRFDWALAEPTSAQDEARRRIVRVRSYVAIKYWLLHHFEFDFLPNRELRQGLARWLNAVVKDERMQSRPADLGIIKSLHKIVRGLKASYAKNGVGALLYHDVGRVQQQGHTAQGTRKEGIVDIEPTGQDLEGGAKHQDDADPRSPAVGDVDLSFAVDECEHDGDAAAAAAAVAAGADGSPRLANGTSGRHASNNETVQAIRAAALKAAAESVVLLPHRQATAHMKPTLAAAQSPNLTSSASRPRPLPHAHNTISRVFVQTVGRLSRFKRVLGNRSTLLPSLSSTDAGHDDLEFEANDSGDLLFIRGGLESFLQYFDIDSTAGSSSASNAWGPSSLSDSTAEAGEQEEDDEDEEDDERQVSDSTTKETPSLSASSVDHSTPASSIDLTPHSFDDPPSHEPPAKPEHDLGIQGVEPSLSSELEDPGESAQPSFGPLGLELSSIGSLTASKHLRHGSDHLHHTTSDQTLRSVSRLEEAVAAGCGESVARRTPSRASSRKAAPSVRWSVKSRASGPRIVQIDDIDLSSDEDDGAVRRALRRLPGARDLRMANNVRDLEPVRQSVDSMASSFAHFRISEAFPRTQARPMSADSVALSAASSQPAFGIVQSEMLDPDEALQGYELVKGFRLDGFDSDDDEPGDVEAALRRLEGIIDEDKQREKAKRVEVLWQKSLARNAGEGDGDGDKGSPSATAAALDSVEKPSRSSVVVKPERRSYSSAASLADNEEEEHADTSGHSGSTGPTDATRAVYDEPKEELSDTLDSFLDLDEDSPRVSRARRESASSNLSYDEQRSPPPSLRAVLPAETGNEAAREAKGSKRALRGPQSAIAPPSKTAVAITNAPQSGFSVQNARRNPPHRAAAIAAAARLTLPNRFGGASMAPPPVHRSFLFAYRSDVIARQMCLIEAELLQAVSWDEMAGSRWKERRYKSEVTDWESFYRDRVRDRLEAQRNNRIYRECAVEAIVARFNLTSNWVASEVVLTQSLDERVAVVSKFIRLALRCYLQSNYASLAQIIFGLSTPWVERLHHTWSRVGYYEMRIWRDLNSFVGPKNNFRHLRNAMQAMAVDAGIEDLSSAGSTNFTAAAATTAGHHHVAKQGCIPFFGLFVSDLMVNDLLPSHLDPSSPDSPPSVDAETGRLTQLAKPEAFDHLAPLPAGVEFEPLVNIYKYRIVSSTIKNVLAFQERAKAYNFEADAGVYVKCLKIRCLQGEQLAKVSHAAEP